MADWSPDGTRLIYHAYDITQPARNVLPQVWSFELSSGAARPFVFNAESSGTPAWSPDGQWVAYQELIGGNYDLVIMNAERTQRTNLSSYSPGAESLPAWSPDGRQIAFVSLYSGNADIWRINADGSDAVNLTLHRPDLPPEVSAWLVIFVALAIFALLLLLWPAGWQPFKSKKRTKAVATV
jgi:TolB protein